MQVSKWIKKERRLWHKHFVPSLIAGIAVAILTLLFEFNAFNVVLFASVGASAVILANIHTHHLTKLRTTIIAYVISIIVSIFVFLLNILRPFDLAVNLFLVIFGIAILLYLFDSFHPPAITAGASFILLERPVVDLVYLIMAIIVLLVLVRFFAYVFSQHLPMKQFYKEFAREF
ncbi:HPP family protein [Candidatus Woesearchaeota archaeon]|nr:HPP family protein [Candidatus Woesearchaeota archaeon]